MRNILGKVTQEERDNAKSQRDKATNPLEEEPGMSSWGEDDKNNDWSSAWETGGNDSSSSWDTNSGSSWGSGAGGGGTPWGTPSTPSTPASTEPKDLEDKVFDTAKQVLLGFFTFFSELVHSFSTFNVYKRLEVGRNMLITSAITGVVGVVFLLLGVSMGFSILLGSIFAAGTGVSLFMFAYDRVSKGEVPAETFSASQGQDTQWGNNSEDSSGSWTPSTDEDSSAFSFEEDDDDVYNFSDEEDDEDLIEYDDELENENLFIDYEPETVDISKNNQILDNMNMDGKYVTRQYLYETAMQVLPALNPNYAHVRDIDQDSEEFEVWDALVQKAANLQIPQKSLYDEEEENLPYLISAHDKLMYTSLEINRSSHIKNIGNFVDEITSVCQYDRGTGKRDDSIYCTYHTVDKSIFVKVMKGTSTTVGVKDISLKEKDFILDLKNTMPVVIGIDADGSPVLRDFKGIDSMLVAGLPRSGKTWQVQSVLTQMTMYKKPSELNFIVLDPKDAASDFKAMTMPHFKGFASSDADILAQLRNIVDIESARRGKLFSEVNAVKYDDYLKLKPDADLPYLYVVIDEIATLTSRMSKENKEEFDSLVFQVITRLPSFGIRAILISHRVSDDILKKRITDMIPFRISVKGDAGHIEKTTSERKFNFKLSSTGDMAVKFSGSEIMFIRASILATENADNVLFFNFLTNMWLKLEPESIKGSSYEDQQKKKLLADSASSGSNKPNIIQVDSPTSQFQKQLSSDEVSELLSGVSSTDQSVVTQESRGNFDTDNVLGLDSDSDEDKTNKPTFWRGTK